jgi:hypothetical protein
MKMHSLRPILDEAYEVFGDKSEHVVAAPQYRAVANTAMGWKNANLRSEMTRLLRRAGVSGWPRLLHSVTLQEGRASRQTELQREFPLHVVCSWLGNSPRIAQQSYLLFTEDDFARAAGASEGEPRVRLFGFSPEGDTCLPVCVSHRTLETTHPFYIP